jgi:hypothetical protein
MKICPMGAKSFHVDVQMEGQTYMMKLIAAFRNFVNTPKKYDLMFF